MFDAIAPRYDLLNHVLSAGMDRGWRNRAVDALALPDHARVLDLCTGTGDLALAAVSRARGASVIGVDFAAEMLRLGLMKVRAAALESRIRLVRGDAASIDKLTDYLVSKYGGGVRSGTTTLYSNKDLGAKIASGSQGCQGMVVVPCSMKSLAGIAHGLSRNLVERAADVMLKERRPLLIVPRETPMSLPQLRNMVLCAEAGAMIMPAMPAFYQMPRTLDDLADFMAGKILSALGFEHELYPAWKG